MLQYNPIQAFTVAFISYVQLYRPCHKTAHRALQALFLLFVMFCRRCVAGTSGYIASLAPSWSVSHATGRPIIIRYIRVQGCAPVMDPCQPVQHIAGHASPAGSSRRSFDASYVRRLAVWHRSAARAHRLAPSTRRGSPAAGARRAARNHWRLAPHLFSGFRPIANRSQQ